MGEIFVTSVARSINIDCKTREKKEVKSFQHHKLKELPTYLRPLGMREYTNGIGNFCPTSLEGNAMWLGVWWERVVVLWLQISSLFEQRVWFLEEKKKTHNWTLNPRRFKYGKLCLLKHWVHLGLKMNHRVHYEPLDSFCECLDSYWSLSLNVTSCVHNEDLGSK